MFLQLSSFKKEAPFYSPVIWQSGLSSSPFLICRLDSSLPFFLLGEYESFSDRPQQPFLPLCTPCSFLGPSANRYSALLFEVSPPGFGVCIEKYKGEFP